MLVLVEKEAEDGTRLVDSGEGEVTCDFCVADELTVAVEGMVKVETRELVVMG